METRNWKRGRGDGGTSDLKDLSRTLGLDSPAGDETNLFGYPVDPSPNDTRIEDYCLDVEFYFRRTSRE